MMWARTPQGQAFLAKVNKSLKEYRQDADRTGLKGRDVYGEMRDVVVKVIHEEFPNLSFAENDVIVNPILQDGGAEQIDIRFPVQMQAAFA